jgi:hypothetical protein
MDAYLGVLMRRHTAALAAILLLSTACSQDEVDLAPASASAEPVEVETVAAEGPDVEELLEEYGSLLAAAAVTGGDALERTLTVTAAEEFDRDCAPTWAHALLDEAGDEPAAVEVDSDGEGVTVGAVDVPVDASTGRALHLGGDCEERLPQPDRSRPEPAPEPEPAPAPQQAAPQLESTKQPPVQQAAPQPVTHRPTPAPAPRPEVPGRVVPPVEVDDGKDLTAQELARRYGGAVWRVETTGCGGEASGTAFAVGERTLISNGHVVHQDMRPRLVARDGATTLRGRVVGWSARPDVAVIEVDQDLEKTLEWEPTEKLEEGQQLVALGYPLPAADFTVTRADILSFQTSGSLREAIRSNGALDYGNSGGPMLTARGKVAGVVTEMAPSRGFQNVPLSYTHDHLRATIEQLQQDRTAERDCNAWGRAPRW